MTNSKELWLGSPSLEISVANLSAHLFAKPPPAAPWEQNEDSMNYGDHECSVDCVCSPNNIHLLADK